MGQTLVVLQSIGHRSAGGAIVPDDFNGVRKMPSYGSQIPTKDRWAIVLYVRALQRSRNATIEDVPEELRKHLRTKNTP